MLSAKFVHIIKLHRGQVLYLRQRGECVQQSSHDLECTRIGCVIHALINLATNVSLATVIDVAGLKPNSMPRNVTDDIFDHLKSQWAP